MAARFPVTGAAAALTGLATVAIVASGCSLRDPSQTTIRVSFPQSTASERAAAAVGRLLPRSGSSMSSSFGGPPSSLADFQCYGLNVTGAGISNESPLVCDAAHVNDMGRMGGLASVADGAVGVNVPAGPARHVQLFAMRSANGAGCPSFETFFRAKRDEMAAAAAAATAGTGYTPPADPFAGLDQPYLIGEADVDLTNDATVKIVAKYDPAHPHPLFQGCDGGGGGQSLSPATAVMGYIAPTGSGAVALFHDVSPVGGGGYNLVTSTSLSAAQLQALSADFSDSSDVTNYPGVSVVSTSTGGTDYRRSALQMEWDVTDVDPAQSTYAAVHIRIRGSFTGTSCPSVVGNAPNTYRVGFAVWDALDQIWVTGFGADPAQTASSWGWGGIASLPRTLSQMAVVNGSGRKVLIGRVESNFASGSAACSSQLAATSAGLRYSATKLSQGGGVHLGTLDLPYDNSAGGGGQMNFMGPKGIGATFAADGGLPPYTYSISGTGNTTSTPISIDSATGHLTLPNATGSFVVVATDSLGASTQSQVRVVNAADPVAITLTPVGSVVAGSCTTVTATLVNYAGSPVSVSSTYSFGVNVSGHNGVNIGQTYMSGSGCSTTQSSVAISSGSFVTFDVKALLAETGYVHINPISGATTVSRADAPMTVPPGTAVGGFTLVGSTYPAHVNGSGSAVFPMVQGVCTGFTIVLTDAGGNQTNASGQSFMDPSYIHTINFSTMGSGVTYYSTADCSGSAISSLDVIYDVASRPFYAVASASSNWYSNPSDTASTGHVPYTGPQVGLAAYPTSTTAAQLVVTSALPSTVTAGSCYAISVSFNDVNGNPSTYGGGTSSLAIMANPWPGSSSSLTLYSSASNCAAGGSADYNAPGMVSVPASSSSFTVYARPTGTGGFDLDLHQGSGGPTPALLAPAGQHVSM